jgi:hypothetical protein
LAVGESRFSTIGKAENAEKLRVFVSVLNAVWRRGSESAIYPRVCSSNIADFIGYSSKFVFTQPYPF